MADEAIDDILDDEQAGQAGQEMQQAVLVCSPPGSKLLWRSSNVSGADVQAQIAQRVEGLARARRFGKDALKQSQLLQLRHVPVDGWSAGPPGQANHQVID